MELKLLMKTARSAVIEIADGGIYYTLESYHLFVNGKDYKTCDTVVTSVFGLKPDTDYKFEIVHEALGCEEAAAGEVLTSMEFKTAPEFVTINVRELGAKGDGVSDDTVFIQSAISLCPEGSRVLIPEGRYLIKSVFLKSGVNIELAKGAVILADTDRTHYPALPGLIQSYDEKDEYNLGTWEGNPLPMFSGIITGMNVRDVVIYGEGCIDGQASYENWWDNCKVMNIAFRPRLIFLSHCKNIRIQGIKLCNSPCWNLHPYFSDDLGFYSLVIENPKDSPNTDGMDPESCNNVNIVGIRFTLGDDCIAIKSGKIYMGRKHKKSCENIHIRQCLMENGHGAVTVGSEMAGGIRDVRVEECLFRNTDRGLRIKTRRGRGRDAVIDDISFRNIEMKNVMTPFVANAFYFCDPDGKTGYVQSREKFPVDDRTPHIGRLEFEDIRAVDCHVAAAHFDGLPEEKIDRITMRNVDISFAAEAKTDVPAMSEGIEKCSKKGIFARNVKRLELKNVSITGCEGDRIIAVDVDEIEE
jgi:polygalacturonase